TWAGSPAPNARVPSWWQPTQVGLRWAVPGPAGPGTGSGEWSGVNRSAGPRVKAQRLHDREAGGPGENLDVRGGQDAGVFGDDRPDDLVRDGVEVGFDSGPEVLPVMHVVRHGVDRGQCFPGA